MNSSYSIDINSLNVLKLAMVMLTIFVKPLKVEIRKYYKVSTVSFKIDHL